MGRQAKNAASQLAHVPGDVKAQALRSAAQMIRQRCRDILGVNERDVEAGKKAGVKPAFLDRMALNSDRLEAVCGSLNDIADQDDPVGRIIAAWDRPNGLKISRVATPIGVLAIIYESRPNVTVDAAAISIKSGNAAILRGGSECIETNKALFDCVLEGARNAGLPPHAIQLVGTPDRAAVGEILKGLNGLSLIHL